MAIDEKDIESVAQPDAGSADSIDDLEIMLK